MVVIAKSLPIAPLIEPSATFAATSLGSVAVAEPLIVLTLTRVGMPLSVATTSPFTDLSSIAPPALVASMPPLMVCTSTSLVAPRTVTLPSTSRTSSLAPAGSCTVHSTRTSLRPESLSQNEPLVASMRPGEQLPRPHSAHTVMPSLPSAVSKCTDSRRRPLDTPCASITSWPSRDGSTVTLPRRLRMFSRWPSARRPR